MRIVAIPCRQLINARQTIQHKRNPGATESHPPCAPAPRERDDSQAAVSRINEEESPYHQTQRHTARARIDWPEAMALFDPRKTAVTVPLGMAVCLVARPLRVWAKRTIRPRFLNAMVGSSLLHRLEHEISHIAFSNRYGQR
jgi:hypothetical protein